MKRLFVLCLLAVSCDEFFPKAPEPLDVTIICDASVGSSCTATTLSQTLDVVLARVAQSPGSRVSLVAVADVSENSRVLGAQTIEPSRRRGRKAVEAHQRRIIASAREYFLTAADGAFHDIRKRSPLFETLARSTLTTPTAKRVVVLVSDLREQSSYGTWECGPLPSTHDFLDLIKDVLPADSLRNTTVYLTCADVTAVDANRCAQPLSRFRHILELWTRSLEQAGAVVHHTTGPLNVGAGQ